MQCNSCSALIIQYYFCAQRIASLRSRLMGGGSQSILAGKTKKKKKKYINPPKDDRRAYQAYFFSISITNG